MRGNGKGEKKRDHHFRFGLPKSESGRRREVWCRISKDIEKRRRVLLWEWRGVNLLFRLDRNFMCWPTKDFLPLSKNNRQNYSATNVNFSQAAEHLPKLLSEPRKNSYAGPCRTLYCYLNIRTVNFGYKFWYSGKGLQMMRFHQSVFVFSCSILRSLKRSHSILGSFHIA